MPFTWSNGKKDNTIIFERLDRAIANTEWLNLFPSASLHNYPIFCSDHSPILLDSNCSGNVGVLTSNMFKFEAIWLSYPDFKRVVRKTWSAHNYGNPCDKVRGYLGILNFLLRKRIRMCLATSLIRKKNSLET